MAFYTFLLSLHPRLTWLYYINITLKPEYWCLAQLKFCFHFLDTTRTFMHTCYNYIPIRLSAFIWSDAYTIHMLCYICLAFSKSRSISDGIHSRSKCQVVIPCTGGYMLPTLYIFFHSIGCDAWYSHRQFLQQYQQWAVHTLKSREWKLLVLHPTWI